VGCPTAAATAWPNLLKLTATEPTTYMQRCAPYYSHLTSSSVNHWHWYWLQNNMPKVLVSEVSVNRGISLTLICIHKTSTDIHTQFSHAWPSLYSMPDEDFYCSKKSCLHECLHLLIIRYSVEQADTTWCADLIVPQITWQVDIWAICWLVHCHWTFTLCLHWLPSNTDSRFCYHIPHNYSVNFWKWTLYDNTKIVIWTCYMLTTCIRLLFTNWVNDELTASQLRSH